MCANFQISPSKPMMGEGLGGRLHKAVTLQSHWSDIQNRQRRQRTEKLAVGAGEGVERDAFFL